MVGRAGLEPATSFSQRKARRNGETYARILLTIYSMLAVAAILNRSKRGDGVRYLKQRLSGTGVLSYTVVSALDAL